MEQMSWTKKINNMSSHWESWAGRLRRIEQAGVGCRETAGAYWKAAGIAVRPWRDWGRRAAAKSANEVNAVITDSGDSKAANEVIADFYGGILIKSGAFSLRICPFRQCLRTYREAIEVGLSCGRCSASITFSDREV